MSEMNEERLTKLETDVRKLLDIEAIRCLRCRYHELINEGRWTDVPELFTEDGSVDFDYLNRASGSVEIKNLFEAAVVKLPFVKQFIHNHVVEVMDDQASGSSYLEAKSISGGEAYVVAARYDDLYLRTESGWKFSSMRLTIYFAVPLREGWAQEDRLKMGR